MKKKTIWDLNRSSLEEYRQSKKTPLTVVLDNVRSLNNIGSVFRTCDAFAVERILICGITASPPSPEIHKTALGAEDSVCWQYYKDTIDCVKELRAQGLPIVSLEQVEGSVSMQDWEDTRPLALILGNEVKGVSQQAVDLSDYCLEIPQAGTKHSFNISCAASMAMWQYFKNYNAIHQIT